MTNIFISHSSKDNAAAQTLAQCLRQQGHNSIFLDFDPDDGIPAGRNWEKELYTRLRMCQAMIVLCSDNSLASRWCFAEITHAKSQGKPIFPIKITDCEVHDLLFDYQLIDWSTQDHGELNRLWRGLKVAGVDSDHGFDWSPGRIPYPGLRSFSEQDAAVYFGREPEIQHTIETLQQLRQFGGPRCLVMLGPSGSGKSSLVNAGVLPRLKRDPESWMIVPPFRPGEDPVRELMKVLATVTQANLQSFSKAEGVGSALSTLVPELVADSGHPQSTVLINIDQAEELLTVSSNDKADQFFSLLAALQFDQSILVLATLRSDWLGEFQHRTSAKQVSFDHLTVDPMPLDRIAQVITGPAKVAGLALEDGLVEAMVADTNHEDALPLLAYALRQLYEKGGDDGLLTLSEYHDQLGGLAGSVAKAADAVLKAVQPISEVDLKSAFLTLVHIDRQGNYSRRKADFSELSQSIHHVLEKFVDARLLTVDGTGESRTLEVTHETLFRSWQLLSDWLDENRGFLIWNQRIREQASRWQNNSFDAGLLLRGGPLAEAETWLSRRHDQIDNIIHFIQVSREELNKENAIKQKNRRRVFTSLVSGSLAATLFAVFAAWQWWQALQQQHLAEQQSQIALARQLGAQSLLINEAEQSSMVQRALLAAESLRRIPNLPAFQAWIEISRLTPRLQLLIDYEAEVSAIDWSPDGTVIVTGAVDGTARIWDADTGELQLQLDHDRPITAVAFSPDASLLGTVEEEGAGHLWRIDDGAHIATLEQQGGHPLIEFSPSGDMVATTGDVNTGVGWSYQFYLWDTATGSRLATLEHNGDRDTRLLRFTPDGKSVFTAGPNDQVLLWDVKNGDLLAELEQDYNPYYIALSPGGEKLAAALGWDGQVWIWDIADQQPLHKLQHENGNFVFTVAFSPDGSWLASGSSSTDSDGVVVWDANTGTAVANIETDNATLDLEFSANGSQLLTTSNGLYVATSNIRLWDARSGNELARLGPELDFQSAQFDPQGSRVLAVGPQSDPHIWRLGTGTEVTRVNHGYPIVGFNFSADSQRMITLTESDAIVSDLAASQATAINNNGNYAAGTIVAADFNSHTGWLATGHINGEVILWQADSGTEYARWQHDQSIHRLAFSADGQFIASASADGAVKIWNTGSNEQTFLVRHDAAVRAVTFRPGAPEFASGGDDATVKIWNLITGQQKLLIEQNEPVWNAGYSPDGRWLAVLTESESEPLRLLDAETGTLSQEFQHQDLIWSFDFSPSGEQLLTASRDGTAIIWDTLTGAELQRLVHEGPVNGAIFSPDGQWVLSWSPWETNARLWEVASGTEVARFTHEQSVNAAAFSPDGKWLVTGSNDGTSRLWQWQAEDIVDEICRRLTRNFEPEEWRRFISSEPYRKTCPNLP